MERLWFKIGEMAARLGVKPKDLRYWEQVIPEIRPRRSHGNLRYYHIDDTPRLERIRDWLAEGLTVGDCRQLLLTGHLARGFDFGGDDEVEAPVLPTPPRRRTRKAKPTQTLRRPDFSTVLESLKQLQNRLAQPLKADHRPKPELDSSPEDR